METLKLKWGYHESGTSLYEFILNFISFSPLIINKIICESWSLKEISHSVYSKLCIAADLNTHTLTSTKYKFSNFVCIYFFISIYLFISSVFMNWCKYDCFLVPPSCCLCHLQILERLNKMCSSGVWKKQQRLLKNMGAHKVMLDLLQVSYDQVRPVLANLKTSYQVHSPGHDRCVG